MATYTTNYNLKKPDATDLVDVADLNSNADTIDTALAAKQNVIDADNKLSADLVDGMPTELPNPNALKITQNGTTVEYDGSTEQNITIESGGGESLIGTYEVDYETVVIGSIFSGVGTSVCFAGDVTGNGGILDGKIITRIEGLIEGSTYQDINAIALFNDFNYGSLIRKPYVRTDGEETFTVVWQSKEACTIGIENIASIKVYGTEVTE